MGKYTIDNAQKYNGKEDLDIFYFKTKDTIGRTINVEGIVSPLERDNRDLVTPIENQGAYPFCAAFSVCTIFEAMYWKSTGKVVNIDQDHVYARAKQIDHNLDDGTYLESAVQACGELLKLNVDTLGIKTYFNTKNNDTILKIKHLVHKYDLVHVGMMIDSSWFNLNKDNYIVKGNGNNAGGHAMVICGYDQQGIYIANSWGAKWGATGFCICPWDIVLKELMYVAVFDVPEFKV